MKKSDPFTMVIFGASGDLTGRRLVPALFSLYQGNLLPDQYVILGLGRTSLTDDEFRHRMLENIRQFGRKNSVPQKKLQQFATHLRYQQLDSKNTDSYRILKSRLKKIDRQKEAIDNYLFYLATPPQLFAPIAAHLGAQGLQQPSSDSGWRRIIVEKPFGRDHASATELNVQLTAVFAESQIYRIDHYLGKETVQNILAFRFANGIFEPLWNRNYIHHVEITAAEQIGVEDRSGYYDSAGALRDMVQNHLLEIVATIAMEPPVLFEPNAVRNEKVKIMQALAPVQIENVIRGQYIASMIRGENVAGYRQEKDIHPDSQTETFVAMKFQIDNWRWGGVPFYIRTGKRLPTRVTEVVIHFRETPHHLFKYVSGGTTAENQLILRIQPDEGILLKFGMKVPGAGYTIKNVGMDFHYSDLANSELPEAYERLLLDALNGDSTLFARADGVEAAWRFIDPILQAWASDRSIKLYGYPAGSWGPKEASLLFEQSGEDWRYPCSNLTGDDSYCEL
ncbi:glucose-6-phosphate dehydrogenase [candidate division KSB1 bacterium]|nr:glucose-6-phosphate dehydrogenase [candidate division KSB1 bacterium]